MTLFIHINIIQETISTFSESFEKNGLENFIFYKKHVWEESSSSSSESMIQICSQFGCLIVKLLEVLRFDLDFSLRFVSLKFDH